MINLKPRKIKSFGKPQTKDLSGSSSLSGQSNLNVTTCTCNKYKKTLSSIIIM